MDKVMGKSNKRISEEDLTRVTGGNLIFYGIFSDSTLEDASMAVGIDIPGSLAEYKPKDIEIIENITKKYHKKNGNK